MEKAIELLMNEHRLIERVLGSLETFAEEAEAGLRVERPLLAAYAQFFREFADACHHGKEEDVLFARMAARGMPLETGPLAVMLHEHRLGRTHVAALREAGESAGPLSVVQTQSAIEHAAAFVPLLRTHILKEDGILYPMAERLLPPDELEEMASRFSAADAARRGEGSFDRLHVLAERLVAAFPPEPSRMAAVRASGPACLPSSGR